MINEYDRRQIDRMKEQLSSFEYGCIDLGSLIGDLEFLLNATESVDKNWKQKIDDQILTLEEVYADALDRGKDKLDSESSKLVSKVIETIKDCISENDVDE